MNRIQINHITLYFLIVLISITVLLFCTDNKNPLSSENYDRTLVTPFGADLKPAEEGPERSAYGVPEIALDTFRLNITGLVDSSYSLNWQEIHNWNCTNTDTMIMYCVEGWQVWGDWKGILVKDLLAEAVVKPEGKYVLVKSADGFISIFSISYLIKYNSILAYEVNGNQLQNHDGFPLRLVAFGKFGYKWSKWVDKLEILSLAQLSLPAYKQYLDPGDVPLERRKFFEGENIEPLDY